MSVLILASLISVGLIGVSAGIYFYGERRLNLIAADVAKVDTNLEALAAEKAALIVERQALMAERDVAVVDDEQVRTDESVGVSGPPTASIHTPGPAIFFGGPDTTGGESDLIHGDRPRDILAEANSPTLTHFLGGYLARGSFDAVGHGIAEMVKARVSPEVLQYDADEVNIDFTMWNSTIDGVSTLIDWPVDGEDWLIDGSDVDPFIFDLEASGKIGLQVDKDLAPIKFFDATAVQALEMDAFARGMRNAPTPASVRKRMVKVRGKSPD